MIEKESLNVLCLTDSSREESESMARFLQEAPSQAVTVLEKRSLEAVMSEIPSETAVLLVWIQAGSGVDRLLEALSARPAPKPLMVVVVREMTEDEAFDLVKRGAHDCLLESEATVPRLVRTLRFARQRLHRHETALADVRDEVERSQRQVRDSEALYHSLVENLVQNIFRKDLQGRFTFANSNFCQAAGHTVEEVLGKTDFDFFPENLAAKYQADDHQVIETQEVLETEEEYESAEGDRLVVKVVKTPVHDAEGETVGMQGIFWDITEQKHAQEELAASRERFALAVRGSTDGIWDWDIETNEIYFSSRFKELLGYGYEELDNRFSEWEDRIYPDDRELALDAFEQHLKSEAPFDLEYRLRCKSGDYRWFRVRGLGVRNDEDKATRMAGSISDVTERKEAEAQLRARTEDLERSNRDLEQFAYIASHDLKEPLRMVTSYVQLLEHRYKEQLGEDARDFIGYAVDGAKRMKRLIDGLLEFSRIGTRGKDLMPTGSEEVFQEVLANLEISMREKEARVTHDPLPRVLADPIQLGQLLQNLVGNALKFCQGVPRVHVRAERLPESDLVEFSVRDNGIGISEEHAEKIFQIYQRLHSRADYEGTGIGLAVCRKIVERHGGRIWVETGSEGDGGSDFRFTLCGVE